MEVTTWVNIAALCQKLNVLPDPGGVFQQHPKTVRRLLSVYAAMAQVEERERKRQEMEAKRKTRSR